MNKRLIQFFVLIALVLLLMGCRKDNLRDVEGAPVVTTSSNYSLQDVRNAIVRAGSSLGWQMQPTEPGHIEGSLFIRAHSAEIDIQYDKRQYSIYYANSVNLKYNNGRIHSNYNGWIVRLETAINNELIQL